MVGLREEGGHGSPPGEPRGLQGVSLVQLPAPYRSAPSATLPFSFYSGFEEKSHVHTAQSSLTVCHFFISSSENQEVHVELYEECGYYI